MTSASRTTAAPFDLLLQRLRRCVALHGAIVLIGRRARTQTTSLIVGAGITDGCGGGSSSGLLLTQIAAALLHRHAQRMMRSRPAVRTDWLLERRGFEPPVRFAILSSAANKVFLLGLGDPR